MGARQHGHSQHGQHGHSQHSQHEQDALASTGIGRAASSKGRQHRVAGARRLTPTATKYPVYPTFSARKTGEPAWWTNSYGIEVIGAITIDGSL